MKLNAPDDLISKRQEILNPVLIMHLSKDFVLICIAAVLLVDNGENLFCEKVFIWRK